MLLTNARLVLPDRVLDPGWLRVDGGEVAAIGAGRAGTGPDVVDLAGRWLVPGLVDLHCHSGGGHGYDTEDPAEVAAAAAHHLAAGTTTTLASTTTDEPDRLLRVLGVLADASAAGVVAGVHAEGPFLAPARCGAHQPALLRAPDPAAVEAVVTAARGHLRQLTLAPELPGALAAVRRLTGHGVVAAVGHTDADFATTRAAYAAGARLTTHLFNGMPPLHHRDPGPVAAALATAGTVCELVADGVHLDPGTVATVFAAVGPDRVALVSDATAAAGAGDGDHRLGAVAVRVRDGVARTVDGRLAGSTATLSDVLRRTVRDAGVAVVDATRAATLTPARVLGLDHCVGALLPGHRADLVVLSADLRVHRVARAGRWVPRRG